MSPDYNSIVLLVLNTRDLLFQVCNPDIGDPYLVISFEDIKIDRKILVNHHLK